MRRIAVDKLRDGMELAKPIYTNNGVILLKEGTLLNEKLRQKIMGIHTEYVYIADQISAGIEVESLISEETKIETKKFLSESLSNMRKGNFTATEAVMSKVENIIEEVTLNPHVMVSLQEIRTKEEYLFMHAINVCVVSLLIGKKMGYTDAQLRHLALGAILHDVGKTQIEQDLTRYREDYIDQEMKIYKQHVRYGYDIIKEMPDASMLAANIALTHHEHYDGTGFPLGKKNTGIHEYARIVAVANEYDNLLYNQPKARKLPHYEIIELMVSRAYTWFDPDIIKIFRKSISPYPVSTGVLLSDGRVAIVSKLNEELPSRPVVRVINQETMTTIEEIDLANNLNLMIIDEKDIDK